MRLLDRFREIWAVDFEFVALCGERPQPICLVARELRTNRLLRLWRDQFRDLPPYSVGSDSLLVAYFASAELGCHLALAWPMPARILDLFVEFRNYTNGLPTVAGNSLIGALTHFGLDSIGITQKEHWRQVILRGGPWTREEITGILDYCQSDVDALARLLPVMLTRIDLPRALYRGRYMAAVASMEFAGTPIDAPLYRRFCDRWGPMQEELIAQVDLDYGIYEGCTFKLKRFEDWLIRAGIPWPTLESGRLDLEDDTFRAMAKIYPIVSPLRELRHALGEMRLNDLAIGKDGRNRCLLSPFASRTGRNQPSNTHYIFGPSVWLRGLIQPPPGWALVYLDWVQQEFGIAAALSGDGNMLEAYLTGDSYLAFAKQAGAVPSDATKESHEAIREQFKQCVLGVQYGMEYLSLAWRINQPAIVARHLLELHHQIYRQYWKWSDCALNHAMLSNWQMTVFGWIHHLGQDPNPRALRNFHMQSHGAEMLRLACCLGTENEIEICAPVHDAVLIAAPVNRIRQDVARMQFYMEQASKTVLGGFKLRTETKPKEPILYPNHYCDSRGEKMWNTVTALL